jgi:hypothetical protein
MVPAFGGMQNLKKIANTNKKCQDSWRFFYFFVLKKCNEIFELEW